jgi:mannose-6-phosphate isomerase-like protein (cupin superfamily)
MSEQVLFSLADASRLVRGLRDSGERPVTTVHRRGTMLLKLYAPRGVDDQQPHSQDELYVVTAGSGSFTCGGERVDFGTGDVLFAAAGVEHRFVDFSDDFEAWVVFYGAEGGEAPGS